MEGSGSGLADLLYWTLYWGTEKYQTKPQWRFLVSQPIFVTDFFWLHQTARCHRLLVRHVGFHLNIYMMSQPWLSTHPPRSPAATGGSKANKPTHRLPSLVSSSGNWTDNYILGYNQLVTLSDLLMESRLFMKRYRRQAWYERVRGKQGSLSSQRGWVF